jgi:hypothetical protein
VWGAYGTYGTYGTHGACDKNDACGMSPVVVPTQMRTVSTIARPTVPSIEYEHSMSEYEHSMSEYSTVQHYLCRRRQPKACSVKHELVQTVHWHVSFEA